MKIRTVNAEDLPNVYDLHLDAFGEEEGELVAQLALDLLRDDTAEPILSLVAEKDDRIVGCVIYSCVTIHNGGPLEKTVILAPLAVASKQQRAGVGSALVRHGLAVLRSQGVGLVLVYGNPQYYSRFGFAAGHQIVAPFPLKYPDAWMACELTDGLFNSVKGLAECALSISRPEYW